MVTVLCWERLQQVKGMGLGIDAANVASGTIGRVYFFIFNVSIPSSRGTNNCGRQVHLTAKNRQRLKETSKHSALDCSFKQKAFISRNKSSHHHSLKLLRLSILG